MREFFIKIVLTLMLLFPLTAGAVPGFLNHQGPISDNSLEWTSGVETMEFALYTHESGGSPIWSESLGVVIENGYYSIVLGTTIPLELALFDGSELWLGITYGDNAEMTPRTRITSVPYAMRAGLASELDSDTLDEYLSDYITNDDLAPQIEDFVTLDEVNTQFSDYVETSDLDAQLEDYVTNEDLESQLADYVTNEGLDTQLDDYMTQDDLEAYLSDSEYISIGGELYIDNNAFVAQDLDVEGYVSLNGSAEIANDLTLGGSLLMGLGLEVGDNASITNDLTVGGAVSVGYDLEVAGSANFNSDLSVSDLLVNNELLVAGNSTMSALEVESDLSVNNDLIVGNSGLISLDLTVGGAGEFDSLTSNSGSIVNDLEVGGSALIGAELLVVGPTSMSGLTVDDSVEIANDLLVGNSALVTGEVTAGSMSVEGDMDIGGDVSALSMLVDTAIIADLSVDLLASSGGIQVGTVSDSCDDSIAGTIRWTGDDLELCDGSAWVSLTATGGVGFSQNTSGLSCKHILDSASSVGDGMYWLDPNGGNHDDAFQAYCDMTTDGGGWTLIINIDSADGNVQEYEQTSFWTSTTPFGSLDNYFTADFKSEAFNGAVAEESVMIWAHYEDNTDIFGYSIYGLTGSYPGATFHGIMNGGDNQTISGNGSPTVINAISWNHNTLRSQSQHGDIFINFNHPLVINKTTGWTAGRNWTRIVTTLENSDYAHTYAGIGGRHEHGIGSWCTRYDASPIAPYCSMTDYYGTDHLTCGTSDPYYDGCHNEGLPNTDRAIDYAVFIR